MQDFYPKEIYVDASIAELATTQRILKKYPNIVPTIIASKKDIKFPQAHTHAKKQLYLAEHQGEPIKSCQGMGDYVCCQYYTIALISDCHLECTYCILQDYLQNNPVITVYTKTDKIFAQVRQKTAAHPDKLFRIGTGELSDSLALDHITELSKDCVAFARSTPNVLLELKTKTANIKNLLDLDHGKRTVVSWSVNPQKYIDSEEHKCDSLTARLDAARACADAGYPIAFHLDPLINFEDWEDQYTGLIDDMAMRFDPKELAWVSIGSLRFTKELKKISQERFPKSKLMAGEILPSRDGKMRYFRPLREDMYSHVKTLIETKLKTVPQYLCMETKSVWQNVFGDVPVNNAAVEAQLTRGFTV